MTIIEIYFLVGSFFCFYYRLKWKDRSEWKFNFPITIGILLFLFAAFSYFDFMLGRIIVGIPGIILIAGNKYFA